MTEVRVVDVEARPTAYIRETRLMSELHEFFPRAFTEVPTAVAEQGLEIAGPPFALFRGPMGEQVDVSGGFPVAGAFSSTGAIEARELPGGRVVTAMHVGPFETLHETWVQMEQFIAQEGLTPGGVIWEVYLTDTQSEPDSSKWETELFLLLA